MVANDPINMFPTTKKTIWELDNKYINLDNIEYYKNNNVEDMLFLCVM